MTRAEHTQLIEADIAAREPVWDQMQMFFMDTELTEADLDRMARVCAGSKYSLEELREILFYEIFPAVRFNFFVLPGGEWSGFAMDWLRSRILKTHTRGRFFQPYFWRGHTKECWQDLAGRIERIRRENGGTDSSSGS